MVADPNTLLRGQDETEPGGGGGGCCPEDSVLVSLPFRKRIGPVLPCAFLFPDLPKALWGGL